MSRIHEALKKAEEERAAAHGTDAVVLPADPAGAPSTVATGMLTSPDATADTAVAAAPEGPLSFDELSARCARPQWTLIPETNVFGQADPAGRVAEQFRTLRSRLYQMNGNGNGRLRTVLITSAVSGEGKTFVASNLAQAIVRQPDRRVLLIDVDLRCSRLHLQLGAPAAPGLTEYLRGEASEAEVIQHGMDGNLCFIPGGKEVPNPSELLANGRLQHLLDRVTHVFDWIILDSPPCLPVADASVLAEHCDGVLLVVRGGVTPAEAVQRAHKELATRNVVGVVLNAVDGDHGSYTYYDYAYRQSDSYVKAAES